MDDYMELYGKAATLSKKKYQLSNSLKDLAKDMANANREKAELAGRTENAIEQEKRKQYSDYVNRCTASISDQIKHKETELSSLKKEKEEKVKQVDKSAILDQLTKEAGIEEIGAEGLESIRKVVRQNMGERFESEIYSRIQVEPIQELKGSLSAFVKDFNNSLKEIKKYSLPSSTDPKLIVGWFVSKVKSMYTSNSKMAFVLLAAVLVGFLFLSKILIPLFILSFIYLGVMNFRKGIFYYKSLYKFKSIKENLNNINRKVKEAAEEVYKKELASVADEYDIKIGDTFADIQSLNDSFHSAKQDAFKTFNFDESEVRNSFDMLTVSIEQKISDFMDKKQHIEKEIASAEEGLQEAFQKMKEFGENLKEDYLSVATPEKDSLMYYKFLLDVKNGKPEMFELAEGSHLILYDNYDDCTNFLKLILFQMRRRVALSLLRCEIWDSVRMGVQFRAFVEEQESLFRIVSDTDKIKDRTKFIKDSLAKRIGTIVSSYKDINSYNQEMINTRSVPEYYYVLVVFVSNIELLRQEALIQLCINGAKCGMYLFVVVDAAKAGSEFIPLLENFGKIVRVTSEKVTTQSLDYTKQELEEQEKRKS